MGMARREQNPGRRYRSRNDREVAALKEAMEDTVIR
jgi:hypothetical protein